MDIKVFLHLYLYTIISDVLEFDSIPNKVTNIPHSKV